LIVLINSLVELRSHPKLDSGSRAIPDHARHDVCYILHKVFLFSILVETSSGQL